MMRGYVRAFENVKDETAPFGFRVDVVFGQKGDGLCWETFKEAERERDWLESHRIEVSLPEGRKHICSGFQIEERKPGEFVIFCDGPFTPSEKQ